MTPNKIVIHHSATRDSGTLSWSAIHSYHVNDNGWSDIGYHAGIEEVNGQYVCLFGRPDVRSGAHTRGHNGHTLGFCFVGDFDQVAPGRQRLDVACRRVLAPWLLRLGLGVEDLVPHRDYSSKTCPGSKFDMDELRQVCAEVMEWMQR